MSKPSLVFDGVVTVSNKATYTFGLEYVFKEHDQQDRSRVENIVGSFGSRVVLELVVHSVEKGRKYEVVRILSRDQMSYGFSGTGFDKKIIDLELPNGSYEVVLKSVNGVQELAQVSVNFFIQKTYLGK